ncbi:amino acid permease [Acetobacter orientalis]|uniref:amino acid permease n=1 Tax=Acetobacter orientalis TaxID=146474 RepID=UPI00241F0379|nr:amino acid permease [Acetobacter orientalis]
MGQQGSTEQAGQALPPQPGKQQNSVLKARHVSMISLGGVIGAGLFVGSGGAIATAGPSVLLSYLLAGGIMFLVNVMLRDIARAAPGRGSFIGQIKHALGPLAGFVAGWVYWLVWITALGVEVIAAATLIAPFVPLPFAAIELLILGSITAINLLSVRHYGEFEYWLAMIKIVAIISFIGVAVYLLAGQAMPVASNVFGHGGLAPNGYFAFLAAVPTALFSMTGSEVATIAALETDEPDRNIARVTRTVAVRLLLFYLTSLTLILCVMPWSDQVRGLSPFLAVLERFHVPYAASLMTIVILSATLSTLNSGLYATSRIILEMAHRGDMPRFFQATSTGGQLPRRAVIASACATLAISTLAVISPTLIFAFLVSIVGTCIMFYNSLIVWSRLRLCKTQAWKGWLTLVLLATALVAMLSMPDSRKELGVGAIALACLSAIGWLKMHATAAREGA